MTDPVLPAPPATITSDRPVPVPMLRLLTSDDDLACVDDLCLPAGTRDRLDAGDHETPVDGMERAR